MNFIDQSDKPQELPVDWRLTRLVTPVKNIFKRNTPPSEQCAASYAVAAVETVEASIKKAKGFLYQMSVQQVVDCSSDELVMNRIRTVPNDGCEGGSL